MKRILAIILAALMLCCVFVACDESEEQKPSRETTAATTEAPTTEKPTEEPTTEEATTDNGEPEWTEYYADCWEEKTRSPEGINEKHKGVGFTFTITTGYIAEVSVPAPSYSDNFGTLKMKIYAWDTDFDTTVAKEPIQVDEFVDFTDNESIVAEYAEELIGPGTYLVLVCDGVDEVGTGVGVWCNGIVKDEYMLEDLAKYDIKSFINGKHNKKKIGEFSFIHVYLEGAE